MRICLDISQIVYEGTGSGRYVVELVKELLNTSSGQEFVLFGSAWNKKAALTSFINSLSPGENTVTPRIYPFPPAVLELLWNSLHFPPIDLLAGSSHIYHSSDWTQAPSSALKVTTVHDLIPFLFPEYVHPRIRKAHELRWRWIQKEVDMVIVDAESTKQDIIKTFSFPSEKISVIPLGCDNRFFEIGKQRLVKNSPAFSDKIAQTRIKYGIPSDAYLLCVGTLEPRKNIQKLITAYRRLESSVKQQYPLVVVGKKAWGEQFVVGENVIFTGYVSDVDLPFLYGGAELFVFPSLYEGFGIPVLEAMASGAPVLCSRRSSIPEIGGDTVHYIEEPENEESILDSLSKMLRDDSKNSTSQQAFVRAQQFTWRKTAQETFQVYETLYKSKG